MQYTHLKSQIRATSTAERELIRATVSARGIAGETKDVETVSFIFYLKLFRKVIFGLSLIGSDSNLCDILKDSSACV